MPWPNTRIHPMNCLKSLNHMEMSCVYGRPSVVHWMLRTVSYLAKFCRRIKCWMNLATVLSIWTICVPKSEFLLLFTIFPRKYYDKRILIPPRHLEQREVLTQKVDSLERKLDEKEEEIRLLTRRNTLEAKNFKTQLANERKKFKELCQKSDRSKPNERSSSHGSDHSSAKDIKLVGYL